MFPQSTQRKYWIFSNDQDVARMRQQANKRYVEAHGSDPVKSKSFLALTEERLLCRHYEYILRDFCKKFQPPMPSYVAATSFQYFKRFYLHNSVMDYHPKQLVATCVYLACKVEEFNLSITQFVANIKGDVEKAMDIILNNELMLMEQLHFHLTVHNPHRPIEGFLIDIKTRCASQIDDPEKLRPHIEDFLDRLMLTDAVLLYSPSQLRRAGFTSNRGIDALISCKIALATILYAADALQENLETYFNEMLLPGCRGDKAALVKESIIYVITSQMTMIITKILSSYADMRTLVKSISDPPIREQIKMIEKKLEKSRNQENNPESKIFKDKMLRALNEDIHDIGQVPSTTPVC
ncbi:Cyclin-H [Nymphon striatum]|nr:Cyclin-H [Nymphon striatum]